jgi:hypothetical protein
MPRFLLPWLALLLHASAQESMLRHVADAASDTHVEVLALFDQPPASGWLPVRVKFANSLPKTQGIQLEFFPSQNWGNQPEARSTFTLAARSGEVLTRDLLVRLPPVTSSGAYPGYSNNFQVKLTGSIGESSVYLSREIPGDEPAVLMSATLERVNSTALSETLHQRKTAATSGGYNPFRSGQPIGAKFDPNQAPTEWLAFSGFDTILLTDADWTTLAPASRNAILEWVRLGGLLIVHGPQGATAAGLGLQAGDSGFGRCELVAVGRDLKLDPDATLDRIRALPGGKRLAESRTTDYQGSWPLQNRFGVKTFNYGILLAVLLAFGVLVGPLNVFVFAKSGKRHRLFITTPLIALATSAVLIGLIILEDGFGGTGIRRVLMEVRPDGGRNSAYIHQEQFSRTGIVGSSRFTVDPLCDFSPVPLAASRWARFSSSSGTGGAFNLQPSGSTMEASGDWWESRSEHGHVLSAVMPTRGRIERGQDGSLVSTFDFPIERLFLFENGQWSEATAVTTGQPFTAKPVEFNTATAVLGEEARNFGSRHANLLDRVMLRSGHFIAITGAAPGIDTHPGIRWRETHTVITGPIQ